MKCEARNLMLPRLERDSVKKLHSQVSRACLPASYGHYGLLHTPLRLRPHFLLITAVNEAVARIVPTDAFQASLALTVTKKTTESQCFRWLLNNFIAHRPVLLSLEINRAI